MLGRPRRLAILAEGCFTRLDAKTAVGVLRYRPEQVAAVIDSTRAGRSAAGCVGVGGEIPVVAEIEEAAHRGADALLIGIAPQGGDLPPVWRGVVLEALERGWDVLSGLHAFLSDDPEFTAMARRQGCRLIDVRRPPAERRVARGRAATLDAFVVLTVGSDCNVGKMTTSLEIERVLHARAVRTRFVATGQTGILIADSGVAVDAIPADFAAGAVENCVVEAAAEADVVLVEGQGALLHPGYSGVTLALLHGACPRALVLCHEAGRDRVRVPGAPGGGPPIPSLEALKRVYESAASWVHPAAVVAVSLQTAELDEAAARAACLHASAELGMEATDPVRFGAGSLAEAIERARKRHGGGGSEPVGEGVRPGARSA